MAARLPPATQRLQNLDLALSCPDNTYLLFHPHDGAPVQCGVMYGQVFFVNSHTGKWEEMADGTLGQGVLERDHEPPIERFVTHGGAIYLTSRVRDTFDPTKETRHYYNERSETWEPFPKAWESEGVFLPLDSDENEESRYYTFQGNNGHRYTCCIGEEEVFERMYLDSSSCEWLGFHSSWETQGEYTPTLRCASSNYETFTMSKGSFITAVDDGGNRQVLDVSDGNWFPFPFEWAEAAKFHTVSNPRNVRVEYGIFDFENGSRFVVMSYFERIEQIYYLSDDQLEWVPFPEGMIDRGRFIEYQPEDDDDLFGSGPLLPDLPRAQASLLRGGLSPESSMASLISSGRGTPESAIGTGSLGSRTGSSGKRKRRMKKSPSAIIARNDNSLTTGNGSHAAPQMVRRVQSFQRPRSGSQDSSASEDGVGESNLPVFLDNSQRQTSITSSRASSKGSGTNGRDFMSSAPQRTDSEQDIFNFISRRGLPETPKLPPTLERGTTSGDSHASGSPFAPRNPSTLRNMTRSQLKTTADTSAISQPSVESLLGLGDMSLIDELVTADGAEGDGVAAARGSEDPGKKSPSLPARGDLGTSEPATGERSSYIGVPGENTAALRRADSLTVIQVPAPKVRRPTRSGSTVRLLHDAEPEG